MRKIAKNIISACGHIGTHKYNWQPESERFAIGYRSSVLIYNIAITNFYFNRACFFVENLVYKYGRIYIYGLEKKNDKKFIKKLENLNQVVTTESWSGGFITNARIFRGKIKNIKKKFSAVLGLSYDYQNYSLPREAKIINLPAIGVVDSNSNAESFTYPIPINSSNFGITRLMTYIFTIKIFKGISKRILGRFRKKIKISNSKKLKKAKVRNKLISKYFKKLKKKVKKKKKNLQKRLKTWSWRYQKKFSSFKKKKIKQTEIKKKNDYIRKNGQDWLTIEAALRRYAEIEKIRKLPKRKIKKFIKRRQLKKQKKDKFAVPKPNDRKLYQARWQKIIEDKKVKKNNSYIRIRTKVRIKIKIKKFLLRQKKLGPAGKKKNIKPKRKKKLILKRKKIKKNARRYKKKRSRYRPNKKWKFKFKPNRFRFKKKRRVIVNKFNKLKKKIFKLVKLKNFRKIISKEKKFKNPKFIYRFLRKAIQKYKIKRIYKFLYKRKKKLILKRKKIKKNKYKKQRGSNYQFTYQKKNNWSKDNNYYQDKKNYRKYYNNNQYGNRNSKNLNSYRPNNPKYDKYYSKNSQKSPYTPKNHDKNYKYQSNYKPDWDNNKNKEKYRYYYKDFGYVKKPQKKKKYYY